jgi:hypothetical protein
MHKKFKTEWLVRLTEVGVSNVYAVVVYRTESAFDDDDEFLGIERLWVAALGYEGGGVNGAFSAVASFGENGFIEKIVSCQEAASESGDFESSENFDLLTDKDYEMLAEVWAKLDELVAFGSDDVSLVANVAVPEGEDFVASDGWEPDDLLEPITAEWQLFLNF